MQDSSVESSPLVAHSIFRDCRCWWTQFFHICFMPSSFHRDNFNRYLIPFQQSRVKCQNPTSSPVTYIVFPRNLLSTERRTVCTVRVLDGYWTNFTRLISFTQLHFHTLNKPQILILKTSGKQYWCNDPWLTEIEDIVTVTFAVEEVKCFHSDVDLTILLIGHRHWLFSPSRLL